MAAENNDSSTTNNQQEEQPGPLKRLREWFKNNFDGSGAPVGFGDFFERSEGVEGRAGSNSATLNRDFNNGGLNFSRGFGGNGGSFRGFNNQLQPVDISDLPGFTEIPPVDFKNLFDRFSRSGGGGGGNSSGNQFLNDLFSRGSGLGQIDSEFTNRIDSLNTEGGNLFGNVGGRIGDRALQVQDLIGGDNIINALASGIGRGSSGGFRSFGGGGGGGGIGNFNIDPSSIFKNLPEFEVRDIETGLPTLDEETLAQLDAQLASNEADFQKLRSEQNNQLLTRLFSQGVNESTVAGEAAGRMNEGLERSLLALRSEDAARRLGIRENQAGRSLQAQLAQLGAETDVFNNRLGGAVDLARTGIQGNVGLAQANATRSAAASAASAQNNAARLGALADMFSTRTRGLTDTLGIEAGALSNMFGSRQSALSDFANVFGNLGATEAGLEVEGQLGLGQLAQQQNASRAQAGANRNNMLMDLLRFQERMASRLQQGQLARQGLQNQRDISFGGFNTDLMLGNLNRGSGPSTSDRLLAVFGSLAPLFFGNNQQGGG